MRKLTVKNFSVIKDAELEFGKITVLIGPQSSGKSLLCKLAYFFGLEMISQAAGWSSSNRTFEDFKRYICEQIFPKTFPASGWGGKPFEIEYTQEKYSAKIVCDRGNSQEQGRIQLELSPSFKHVYEQPDARISDTAANAQVNPIETWVNTEFKRLQGHTPLDRIRYIPSGRSYFMNSNRGYKIFQDEGEVDLVLRDFAPLFERSRAKSASSAPSENIRTYLQGRIVQGNQGYVFNFDDGRILPLDKLSSGGQEIFPLLSVLDLYATERSNEIWQEATIKDLVSNDEFYIEEPEAHVFPSTQNELVRLFTELNKREKIHPQFAITTHSPYILSAFGNLVKAGMVGAQSKEDHAAVAKVIPEKYWIKEGDFAAYKIESGKLDSIFDKKTGQIDGDYLDDVSGKISEEFGQLLEIQYGR